MSFIGKPKKQDLQNENKPGKNYNVREVKMGYHGRAFGRDITNYQFTSHDLRSKNAKPGVKTDGSKSANSSFIHVAPKPDEGEMKLNNFYKEAEMALDKTLNDVDRLSIGLPLECVEYADGIFYYLREIENQHLPKPAYLKYQSDLNEKMRSILLDWLVEVHLKFKLLPETLFLTINLIDRYLECEKVMRQKLQLVGVTAMLIASKYEEIYAPEIRDFVYITDKAYTKGEILKMENDILARLNFNITVPSSYRFLERYSKLIKGDDLSFNLGRYLIELASVEYKMLKYQPSLIAAAAIYLSQKILKKEFAWTPVLVQQSKYKETEIKPCAKDLCLILKNYEKGSLHALKRKFSLPKFKEVAKIKIEG